MIDQERKKEAQTNIARYLQDGLIKKEKMRLQKRCISKMPSCHYN